VFLHLRIIIPSNYKRINSHLRVGGAFANFFTV